MEKSINKINVLPSGTITLTTEVCITLTPDDVRKISEAYDNSCYEEDIKYKLYDSNILSEIGVSEEEFGKISNDSSVYRDFLDRTIELYKDRLSDDDTWSYILDTAIKDALKEVIDEYK